MFIPKYLEQTQICVDILYKNTFTIKIYVILLYILTPLEISVAPNKNYFSIVITFTPTHLLFWIIKSSFMQT